MSTEKHSPLSDSYEEILHSLATRDREYAARLPYHLGITPRPDGGWEDYTALELLYDMPIVVARDLAHSLSRGRLSRFRFAHHCIGFCGLVQDRIADGQVRWNEQLRSAYLGIEQVAREAVDRALEGRQERHVGRALRSWISGVTSEKRALRRGSIAPASYGRLVSRKTAWLSCMTLEMLEFAQEQARVPDLQTLMDLVILGLQARDDALDAEEDKSLRGRSFPQALGVDPLTLGMFGQSMLATSIQLAEHFRFSRVARWLETNQTPELISRLPGVQLLAPLGVFTLTNGLQNHDFITSLGTPNLV